MIVRARAPVRIDFAGGWSDVPRFAAADGGVVTNAALALHVQVECRLGGKGIRLHAEDLGVRVAVPGPAGLAYDGALDLHKAALNMLPVTGGVEVLSRSEVPPGSGLGASGALDVALVAALAHARAETHAPAELAELAFELEAVELGLDGGRQDQYAAALGGWHELRFSEAGVAAQPIVPSADAARELGTMLAVAYTGQSHFSAQTHRRVWEAYAAGAADVVDALRAMRDLGREAAVALRAGDWALLARVVDENWRHQQRLDPTIASPAVRRIEAAARAAGAWAVKATGAGAGGCLLVVGSAGGAADLRDALRHAGARVLPTVFDFAGVQVWEEDDAPGD